MGLSNTVFLAVIGPFSWLEAALIAGVIILVFMIWKITRHQECHYTGEPEPAINEVLHALAGSTHGHITHGNSITVIQDAAYFDVFEETARNARRSIHFETFLWADGDAGTRVTRALVEAAARGLQVRVLVDASGCAGLSHATAEKLRQAGCAFHRFHRYRIHNFGRLNVRDHRKILVTDGNTAIVGGHCITDDWLKDGKILPRHRDISALVTGPVTGCLQSCFLENWTEVTGELFTDEATFPPPRQTGTIDAHVAYVKADRCPSAVQVLHHLSIGYANKRIRIQNPYFLPDPSGAKALAKASARGVDVRIMIPALTATDSPWITRAGRYQFQRLLEAGVRIYEYQKTLLHQKVTSIDGVWCGIGSSNFDDRSFEINDEVTLGIADAATALELERIFEQDAEHCIEITLEQWKKRKWHERATDAFLYLFNEQF